MDRKALLNIAPGRHEGCRKAAAGLKRAGVWESLCVASLWQEATRDGNPVHTEDSALATILDHLMEPMHGMADERSTVLALLGPDLLSAVLDAVGKRNMTMAGWTGWRQRLGQAGMCAGCRPEEFSDGWALRHMRPDGMRAFPESERRPGEIPETDPDEKVIWAFNEKSGDVYAVPY